MNVRCLFVFSLGLLAGFAGCANHPPQGQPLARSGDEIVVCGQMFHTGTPVVTWMDPGGFDAYRVERRFSPFADSDWAASSKAVKDLKTPNRYSLRRAGLSDEQIEQVRGGGWTLPLLRDKVDQFVLHYDVAGTSRQCFNILHDRRDLSVHFMLDVDGTIYQTLDLKERAWHATISNDRSIGIEIANIGAYPDNGKKSPLDDWYQKDARGKTRLIIPASQGAGKFLRTPNFAGRPAREEPVVGLVQGKTLRMYDLTPEQYESLAKLTATLCSVFPKIVCDYPRDPAGALVTSKLPDDQLANYHGVMGHFHIQTNKIDPGPALQWDWLIDHARKMMPATNSR